MSEDVKGYVDASGNEVVLDGEPPTMAEIMSGDRKVHQWPIVVLREDQVDRIAQRVVELLRPTVEIEYKPDNPAVSETRYSGGSVWPGFIALLGDDEG